MLDGEVDRPVSAQAQRLPPGGQVKDDDSQHAERDEQRARIDDAYDGTNGSDEAEADGEPADDQAGPGLRSPTPIANPDLVRRVVVL